jgi:hypothetical protein
MSETDWDLYNNLEDENNFDIDLISYQTVHFVRKKDFEVGKWLQTIFNKVEDLPFEEINLDYYIESIYKEIHNIDKVTKKNFEQLTLF